MIAAAVDCSRPALEKLLFRDRHLRFWLTQLFPWCEFITLSQPAAIRFDRLLVFALDRFPVAGVASRSELQRWLARTPAGKDAWLYGPEHAPFFVVSRTFLAKKNIALKPGLFNKLKTAKEVRLLPLAQAFPVTPPAAEPRRVEQAVVDLQAGVMDKKGVCIEDFANFYMDGLPAVGRRTVIGTGVVIKGDTQIGSDVHLFPHCFIENSVVGDRCLILPGSVIRDSRIANDVQLGPYCHLRNGTLVETGAKIGNFVEMKKSVFGRGSKAMHLTYVGDARVGKKVNIGAGTITCNYDGTKKNPTVIEDNVFIGSGTELVAPVTVHRNSYVGAGSTITENVPHNALAIARQRQRNILNWALRKMRKPAAK